MALTHVLYEAEGWGVGELWIEGESLLQHELPAAKRPVRVSGPVEGVWGKSFSRAAQRRGLTGETWFPPYSNREVPPASHDHPLVDRIRAYFAGERVAFDDVVLDLDWCTPFQRAVVAALRSVAYGEAVTYGEVAALAGHPNAQRAVGSFCARNRFALVLPCHRVVAADGVGPYGSLGTDYKRRLLELEGYAV